jgi:hypothetical protein
MLSLSLIDQRFAVQIQLLLTAQADNLMADKILTTKI